MYPSFDVPMYSMGLTLRKTCIAYQPYINDSPVVFQAVSSQGWQLHGSWSVFTPVLQERGKLVSGSGCSICLQGSHKMGWIASNVILDFLSSEDNCLRSHSKVINFIDWGRGCIFKMFENVTQSHQLLFFSQLYSGLTTILPGDILRKMYSHWKQSPHALCVMGFFQWAVMPL